MNIDELTYKQLREIAAIFAPSTTQKPSPYAGLVGRAVVIRANESGVWVGVIDSVQGTAITLAPGARRAWYWEGAGSCSGLAETGPTGGKWPAPSSGRVVVADVFEVLEATADAMAAVAAQPVWTGR